MRTAALATLHFDRFGKLRMLERCYPACLALCVGPCHVLMVVVALLRSICSCSLSLPLGCVVPVLCRLVLDPARPDPPCTKLGCLGLGVCARDPGSSVTTHGGHGTAPRWSRHCISTHVPVFAMMTGLTLPENVLLPSLLLGPVAILPPQCPRHISVKPRSASPHVSASEMT